MMSKKDYLIGRIARGICSADLRELALIERFAWGLLENPSTPAWPDKIGRTLAMLCNISSESLVDRVYRFEQYI